MRAVTDSQRVDPSGRSTRIVARSSPGPAGSAALVTASA